MSELERSALDVHVRLCPACAQFLEDSADLTRVVREAPLESPTRPLWVARRRRPQRLRQAAVVVAAAAAATGMGAIAARLSHTSPRTAGPSPLLVAQRPTPSLERDLVLLRTHRLTRVPVRWPRNRLIV